MDYKKKYEQALNRAKVINPGTADYEVAVKIFPELKESEDERNERIRKALKSYFDSEMSDYGNIEWMKGIRYGEVIAWLEKQGEKKPTKWSEEDERIRKECISIIDAWDKSCRLQGDYCEVAPECIAWLEKQGGAKLLDYQKPANETNPKFKVGDWIVSECDNVAYIESISKTKVLARSLASVKNLPASWYNLRCIDGYHEKMSIDYVDKCWHLWTIQDAKDGDVLVTNNRPFIFRGLRDIRYPEYPVAYCGINTENNFYTPSNDYGHWTRNSCLPATKEQRDLLFLKMCEAGYEWDAEKKEVKKIEQKSVELPNGEDYDIDGLGHAIQILEKTIGQVDGYRISEHKRAIEAVTRVYKRKSNIV